MLSVLFSLLYIEWGKITFSGFCYCLCALWGGGFPSLPCLCETKALLWVEHPDVIWDTGTATDSLSSGLPLGIHKECTLERGNRKLNGWLYHGGISRTEGEEKNLRKNTNIYTNMTKTNCSLLYFKTKDNTNVKWCFKYMSIFR